MPLQRRVPKFGFKNINRVEYKAINLDVIQSLIERKNVTEITPEVLRNFGVISRNDLVKVLGRGELKSKINVTAHKFSDSAKAVIEGQGGNCSEI
jgi:large subunit ribosomal protein L15